MAKKRMQMAQKSWRIEEIFPRFVNAQMAKGVSDKTVLTYNRHFRSLGYHLDMTMTFDELTKEALFWEELKQNMYTFSPANHVHKFRFRIHFLISCNEFVQFFFQNI